MRIGICTGDHVPEVGGGFTFVSQILRAFLESNTETCGHEFVVFCHPSAISTLQGSVTTKNNMQFCALPPRGALGRALMALKHYSPLIGYLLRWQGALQRMANLHKVELIWFIGGTVYETPDIPYIATVWDVQHRTHPWFPEVAAQGRWDFREATYSRFLRRATRIITGTEVGAEQLGYYYQIPRSLITVLPFPTPDFREDGNRSVDNALVEEVSKRKYIYYPAQFWPHKNHVNLLLALKLLHEQHGLLIDVVLTGSDKGNKAHVVETAKVLGLIKYTHFMGFVAINELVFLYRHALTMVYPSFSGPDNLPPLEAFSLDCPVVIANYQGAYEQLGDAALYFDPHQPHDIAERLVTLLNNTEIRDALVKKGRECATNRTADGYVTGVMAIFDEFQSVRRCWGGNW